MFDPDFDAHFDPEDYINNGDPFDVLDPYDYEDEYDEGYNLQGDVYEELVDPNIELQHSFSDLYFDSHEGNEQEEFGCLFDRY